jgi:hypothetical protein
MVRGVRFFNERRGTVEANRPESAEVTTLPSVFEPRISFDTLHLQEWIERRFESACAELGTSVRREAGRLVVDI